MDLLDFTEEEIAEQLAILGYRNIPHNRLQEFKRDLDELIQCANWEELAPPPLVNATKCQPAVRPPNPPAYTKEKVGRCFTDRSGEGFFLHEGKVNYDREWFKDKPGEEEKPSTCFPALFSSQETAAFPGKDNGCKQGHCDSYAQNSVAPKLQLPPSVPTRVQMKPHSEDTLDSSEPSEVSEPSEQSEPSGLSELLEPPYSPHFPDRYSSSADGQGRRAIKRKVLRKREGRSLICDESVYSDDSDVASSLEERLADLHVTSSPQPDSETESEDTDSYDSSYDLAPARREAETRPQPKSFIRPILKPHGIKKSDPVTKYRQYAELWKMIKFPGERERRDLHHDLQNRLAYQPPPPRARRVYMPNKYIVPTDKKRSALRWEIRHDLANGIVPRCNYRF